MRAKKRIRSSADPLVVAGLSGSFTDELRDALAQHADILHVSPGAVLAQAGRMPRQFVAVVDGYVEITDEAGCTRVAGPGAQIGAAELVGDRPHSSTVVTRSAATLVVVFGPAFRWTARAMAAQGTGTAALAGPLVRRPDAHASPSTEPALAH